jgi:hypothetical protein
MTSCSRSRAGEAVVHRRLPLKRIGREAALLLIEPGAGVVLEAAEEGGDFVDEGYLDALLLAGLLEEGEGAEGFAANADGDEGFGGVLDDLRRRVRGRPGRSVSRSWRATR